MKATPTRQQNSCATASKDWSFRLSLTDEASSQILNEDSQFIVPKNVRETFIKDGFVAFENVLTSDTVAALNQRFEDVLHGQYDRESSPDKVPNLNLPRQPKESLSSVQKPATSQSPRIDTQTNAPTSPCKANKAFLGGIYNSGRYNRKRTVIQVINMHKADTLFCSLACHPMLGRVVAELANWSRGTRLAQDQVWAKPPGCCKPISFHQDSPYFMFTPEDVVTVWVALDEMDEEIGPLEYVKGSHMWKSQRCTGANSQFFEKSGGMHFLRSAAIQAGVMQATVETNNSSTLNLTCEEECRQALEIVTMAGLSAGSISIHNGRTWHGSGKNLASRPRRGLGLHFVPANVRFTTEALKSQLWRPYVEDHTESIETLEVPLDDFPITWQNL